MDEPIVPKLSPPVEAGFVRRAEAIRQIRRRA